MAVDVRRELPLPRATMRFHVVAHSDRGAVRRLNEDSFLTALPIFAVADGMGGHSFGDRASQTAVASFSSLARDDDEVVPLSPQAVLEAIRDANDAVLALTDDPASADAISGTTLTGVALVEVGPGQTYHWMAFNVGDSRTYSWDGRRLRQLSVDHSAVQELIDLGEITELEASSHPDRNVVTHALGAALEVDADIWLLPATGHQTFLLCSDGLTKELAQDEIERIIVFHDAESLRNTDDPPLTLAERLVNAAIAAGGSDNVTVVVVESEALDSAPVGGGDETVDRDAMHHALEETRPRG